jgi:hypothetical protein
VAEPGIETRGVEHIRSKFLKTQQKKWFKDPIFIIIFLPTKERHKGTKGSLYNNVDDEIVDVDDLDVPCRNENAA